MSTNINPVGLVKKAVLQDLLGTSVKVEVEPRIGEVIVFKGFDEITGWVVERDIKIGQVIPPDDAVWVGSVLVVAKGALCTVALSAYLGICN